VALELALGIGILPRGLHRLSFPFIAKTRIPAFRDEAYELNSRRLSTGCRWGGLQTSPQLIPQA
jgi:hypothetical protein